MLIPLTIVSKYQGDQRRLIKALLDSRARASIIEEQHITHLCPSPERPQWVIVEGKFDTNITVKVQFQLQDLNPTATVMYDVRVTKSLGLYYVIIGQDLLHRFGLGFYDSTKNGKLA